MAYFINILLQVNVETQTIYKTYRKITVEFNQRQKISAQNIKS